MRFSDASTTETIAERAFRADVANISQAISQAYVCTHCELGPRNEAAVVGVEYERWQFDRLAERVNLRARHGFQQQARIPCYRGVRTR